MSPWQVINDYSKTVLTLAVAFLGFTVTFAKDILGEAPTDWQIIFLMVTWVSLIASILSGLLVIPNLTNFLRKGGIKRRRSTIGWSNVCLFTLSVALFSFVALGVARFVPTLLMNTGLAQNKPQILAKWIQLVPEPNAEAAAFPIQALVRLVLPKGASCPVLETEGPATQLLKTVARTNPEPKRFPIKVCEALVPRAWGSTSLHFADGQSLNVPAMFDGSPIKDIAILGDTGCRGLYKQRCAAPHWPFAPLVAGLARAVGSRTEPPDLVIHVGDYVYGGTDFWANWHAEFFEPARPLLEAAPWVMVRGNHESCTNNAGQGWLLFFDPKPNSPTRTCEGRPPHLYQDPYALDLSPELRLVVLDTANAGPFASDAQTVLDMQFMNMLPGLMKTEAGAKSTPAIWVLSHVPIWGIETLEPKQGEWKKWPDHEILRHAESKQRLAPPVTAVISGDFHGYQELRFPDLQRPKQYIIGSSGVKLDDAIRESGKSGTIVRFDVTTAEGERWVGSSQAVFGYLHAVRSTVNSPWEIQLQRWQTQ